MPIRAHYGFGAIVAGLKRLAYGSRSGARWRYERWGATAKVGLLEMTYPKMRELFSLAPASATLGAFAGELDASSVIKAAQAISSEIVLKNLIQTLLTLAVKQAGAERGLLILVRDGIPRLEAKANTDQHTFAVNVGQLDLADEEVPQTVLQYVMRMQERVILDDAATSRPFAMDEYIRRRRPRSVLCQPLTCQGRLIGLLYLENRMADGVFTAARTAVLEVLAAQAAISLENAYLYSDLRARESRSRMLSDSNIVGMIWWSRDGAITDANDSALRMLGYSREDLRHGALNTWNLIPPEEHELNRRILEQMSLGGAHTRHEREILRRDGTRVPVLVGTAFPEASQELRVSYVVDLTLAKRAEAEARESERRYREIQLALAHANRVMTVGQLAASISHEMKQPIGANAAQAQIGLNWLSTRPPNLEAARQAFDQIIKGAEIAGEVMDRIRGLARNAPIRKERLQINEAIQEVMPLTCSEVVSNRVSVRMQLAGDLPVVEGDRVQLQQVLLNLILNAVEAMSGVDEGPRELVISTEPNQPHGVLIAVRDSGPGIAPGDLERVFDSFYTTKASGMGIGLSICRSIIDAHRGRLWAESNGAGGAVFKFTLPAPELSHESHAR